MTSNNKLQQELKQSVPFPTKGQEALVGLMRTSDMVRRKIGDLTKPYGITPQHYNVLRILRGAGNSGLPILEIARRMIENSPGITRFIGKLESEGLINRKQLSTDRRCHICKITAKGQRVLSQLDEPINSLHREILHILTEQEITSLIDYMDRIREEGEE